MDSLALLEIIAQRFIKELSDTLIVLKDLTAREFAPGYTIYNVKVFVTKSNYHLWNRTIGVHSTLSSH